MVDILREGAFPLPGLHKHHQCAPEMLQDVTIAANLKRERDEVVRVALRVARRVDLRLLDNRRLRHSEATAVYRVAHGTGQYLSARAEYTPSGVVAGVDGQEGQDDPNSRSSRIRPITSAHCGTTALPSAFSRGSSSSSGTPSSTRRNSGTVSHPAQPAAAGVHCPPISPCWARACSPFGSALDTDPSSPCSATSDGPSPRDPLRLPGCSRRRRRSGLEEAMTKIRRRRWGAPTSAADSAKARVPYPIASRSSRTSESQRCLPDATFSTTTQFGRSSPMIRRNSNQRPERVPSLIPAPLPAEETSWQGKPPQMTSTGSS